MAISNNEIIEITDKEIGLWKKKHGEDNIYVYEADGRKCWLNRPNRNIISAAATTTSDVLKQKELLIRNCWLGGDTELRDNDKYFFGLANVIDGIMEVVQGELKKA